jgi:hypothetical protein
MPSGVSSFDKLGFKKLMRYFSPFFVNQKPYEIDVDRFVPQGCQKIRIFIIFCLVLYIRMWSDRHHFA